MVKKLHKLFVREVIELPEDVRVFLLLQALKHVQTFGIAGFSNVNEVTFFSVIRFYFVNFSMIKFLVIYSVVYFSVILYGRAH